MKYSSIYRPLLSQFELEFAEVNGKSRPDGLLARRMALSDYPCAFQGRREKVILAPFVPLSRRARRLELSQYFTNAFLEVDAGDKAERIEP